MNAVAARDERECLEAFFGFMRATAKRPVPKVPRAARL
jgi:hypothetical protein